MSLVITKKILHHFKKLLRYNQKPKLAKFHIERIGALRKLNGKGLK